MYETIKKEIIKNVKELSYKGFEKDTFFNKESEYHVEAYEDVVYYSTENISEDILDVANLHLDNSEFGGLAYAILRENTYKKIEELVIEHIEELFFKGGK